jgi:hypothetical protein
MGLTVQGFNPIATPQPEQRWWEGAIDEGARRAPITVWMTESGWTRLHDQLDDQTPDEYAWMRREVVRTVGHLPMKQRYAAIRDSGPINLVVPGEA